MSGDSGGFSLFNIFCTKIPVSKSIDPDQMPYSAASELGLHCLHMSSKWLQIIMGKRGNLGIIFHIIPLKHDVTHH